MEKVVLDGVKERKKREKKEKQEKNGKKNREDSDERDRPCKVGFAGRFYMKADEKKLLVPNLRLSRHVRILFKTIFVNYLKLNVSSRTVSYLLVIIIHHILKNY